MFRHMQSAKAHINLLGLIRTSSVNIVSFDAVIVIYILWPGRKFTLQYSVNPFDELISVVRIRSNMRRASNSYNLTCTSSKDSV